MRVLGCFLIGIILASCSPKHAQTGKSKVQEEYVFFPQKPDTARIQFLTSINGSLDIVKRKSKFEATITGEEINSPIIKPYGFNLKDNRLIICDVSLKGLEDINLEEQTFEYFRPSGSSTFLLPINCMQDDDGNIYVVDTDKDAVLIFNEKLALENSIDFTKESKPISIEFDKDRIYIVDLGQNRVNIYDKSTLEYIDYFPKTVLGNDDWLAAPTNIALFEDKIYVTDLGATNVKVFSKKGDYLSSIGQLGQRLGMFVRPKGIDLDKDGNIYVVDAAFNNVQIFNNKGQFLMPFGGVNNTKGNLYLPTQLQIDYSSIDFFKKYVHPSYDLEYLILVANQYGNNKITVYGKIKLKE